jgi:hypothetical protein
MLSVRGRGEAMLVTHSLWISIGGEEENHYIKEQLAAGEGTRRKWKSAK